MRFCDTEPGLKARTQTPECAGSGAGFFRCPSGIATFHRTMIFYFLFLLRTGRVLVIPIGDMRRPRKESLGANYGGTCAFGRLLYGPIRSDHHRAQSPPLGDADDEIVGRLWRARESNVDAASRRRRVSHTGTIEYDCELVLRDRSRKPRDKVQE